MGGRCGIRDEEQLQAALAALARRQNSIALRGIEVYEGVLDDETAIRALLERAVGVTRTLMAEKRFYGGPVRSRAPGPPGTMLSQRYFLRPDWGIRLR